MFVLIYGSSLVLNMGTADHEYNMAQIELGNTEDYLKQLVQGLHVGIDTIASALQT